MVSISAIQLCSVPNVEQNIDKIDRILHSMTIDKEHIVVLPECCLYFGGSEKENLQLANENIKSQNLTTMLSNLAIKYKIYLVAGSIPVAANESKYTNTCIVFSPNGVQIQSYDKIHLFDAQVNDSEKSYLESQYTQSGEQVCLAKTESTHIGLTICYDLRFPELYRQLREFGADIITVPSAFTTKTGKAHWQPLLQARAIENQVYIIAAGQQGQHKNGRETWGHSMIISPWGEILNCLPEGEGVITSTYSKKSLEELRHAMPVIAHNKFKSKLK